jgi:thiosulfate:glutathione sulfurtransferase
VWLVGRSPSLLTRSQLRPIAIRHESNASKLPPPTTEAWKANAALHQDWTAPLVHYDTVKQWSESPSPVRALSVQFDILLTLRLQDRYLIDVREPDETVQGTIPSAVTLPLSILPRALYRPNEEFKKNHSYDKPKRDQEIIFYCRSGKRSQTAADIARRNGYTKWVAFESHLSKINLVSV